MWYSIYVAVATFCLVSAHDITYRVIHSPNSGVNRQQANRMGVRFHGSDRIYSLDNTDSLDPLVHVGTGPSGTSYQFVVLNNQDDLVESEPFYRSPLESSLFDFYGRVNTIQEDIDQLPRVSYSYKKAKNDHVYGKGLDRSLTHPKAEIPTLHIQTGPSEYEYLLEKVLQDVRIRTNVTRITSKKIEKYNNVNLELSGQTSRLFKKLSYSLHMDKNEKTSINGYRRFKIRSCATDPSYLREKIFYDILEASDLPAAKSSFVRLFVNEEPQGLFLFVDNYKNPFFKNVLGNNGTKYKNGALFQGSKQENILAPGKLQMGANLGYFGSRASDYIEPSSNSTVYSVLEDTDDSKIKDDFQGLIDFISFIHKTEKYDYTKKKTQKKLARKWNRNFDVSLFLKHMVLEILLGHNDGYLGAAHNYMLYNDPDQKGRFVWIASDLDQTLGSTLIAPRSSIANSTFNKLDRYGLLEKADVRPLLKQLLKVKEFSQQFYHIFKDIHDSLFKSGAITNHVAHLKSLIKEDAAWDRTIDNTRIDNFLGNRTEFDRQINEKVLQLPLGPDFWGRIDKIDFHDAIDGPLQNHPSITSLVGWFKQTGEYLKAFVSSSEFKHFTE